MSNDNMESMDLDLLDLNIDPEVANALIHQVLSPENNDLPQRSPGNYLDDEDKTFEFDEDLIGRIDGLDLPGSPMVAQTAESVDQITQYDGYSVHDLQQPHASSNPTAIESAYHLAYDPRFNDCHKMRLKAYYQHILIVNDANKSTEIEQPEGAFVFHQKQSQVGLPLGLPPTVAPVRLPELAPGLAKTDKVTKFTATVLGDMTRGLHVQYHQGFMYATRHCISRVFYWSSLLNSTQSVKLERLKPTAVFDFRAYFDRLHQLAQNGYDFRHAKRPVVVFTFGQQWNGSSSNLKDMYVRVEVTPIKAAEELERVSARGWEHESITKSMKEDDLERSERGSETESCIMSILHQT
ncbi:interferon regulatory factor 5-like [Amphiura filiformis]|uniref:interferon regulatory factor 5-like n=1 Tax=Amphiura filiformis TaxID=82378 RepID=UPI003B2189A6